MLRTRMMGQFDPTPTSSAGLMYHGYYNTYPSSLGSGGSSERETDIIIQTI